MFYFRLGAWFPFFSSELWLLRAMCHHGYVKLYTIVLWQMLYMDSVDAGADAVPGGPDAGADDVQSQD